MQDTLLVELLTEELPPKALERLSQVFCDALVEGLRQDNLLTEKSAAKAYATPRRLAVSISHVLDKAPDQPVEVPGPSVKAGAGADGKPTQALAGFAKKNGVSVDELVQIDTPKGKIFACRKVASGTRLETSLELKVEDALKRLPVPKMMRWGASDVQFVRPVHGLVMMHGKRVVAGKVLGLESGNVTHGHRFQGVKDITVPTADAYEEALAAHGQVIASFDARRAETTRQLGERAAGLKTSLGPKADYAPLLDEVTALVEYPTVYVGEFEPEFLAVPQECLILTMRQNQKYFPLFDAAGKLTSKFLIVSNMRPADPKNIVEGNQRVLRARLADARFFYDQDRKTKLEARVAGLANIVYHNKLGSQLERVQRLQKLAGMIAARLGADRALAERAAYLCKADLVTGMVGEFPELQGVMGEYYARHDGEAQAVARAIDAHYHPRFAHDSLPQDNIGASVALADKLDTLVGIFGIGLIPTGDRDPFALRRHALGVLRILSEKALPLDLAQLLQAARAQFPTELISDYTPQLFEFMLERLRGMLREQGFETDEIEAVASQQPTRIDLVVPRLQAVQAFRKLPEAAALAGANKRIQNILRKTTVPDIEPDLALMCEPAEKALLSATVELRPLVASLLGNGDYTAALCALARARREVDTFFDEVMVMTDEPRLRDNRLALLNQLGTLMNQVADISKLAA